MILGKRMFGASVSCFIFIWVLRSVPIEYRNEKLSTIEKSCAYTINGDLLPEGAQRILKGCLEDPSRIFAMIQAAQTTKDLIIDVLLLTFAESL